jgi:hypothetical protein
MLDEMCATMGGRAAEKKLFLTKFLLEHYDLEKVNQTKAKWLLFMDQTKIRKYYLL